MPKKIIKSVLTPSLAYSQDVRTSIFLILPFQHDRPIHVPVHYYPDDDPAKPPLFRWRAHAHLLYENWLNYYVYQNTPYDLGDIQRVKHEK